MQHSKIHLEYHLPLTDDGVKEACRKLEKALEKTQDFKEMKITILFDSTENPRDVYSVRFVQDMVTPSLTLTGLNQDQNTAILNVFKTLNIDTNSVTIKEKTVSIDQGEITLGNEYGFIGIRADISSYRRMFPGKTDEELHKLFG